MSDIPAHIRGDAPELAEPPIEMPGLEDSLPLRQARLDLRVRRQRARAADSKPLSGLPLCKAEVLDAAFHHEPRCFLREALA